VRDFTGTERRHWSATGCALSVCAHPDFHDVLDQATSSSAAPSLPSGRACRTLRKPPVMRKKKRFKELRCLTQKLLPLSFFAYFAECLTFYRPLDPPRRSIKGTPDYQKKMDALRRAARFGQMKPGERPPAPPPNDGGSFDGTLGSDPGASSSSAPMARLVDLTQGAVSVPNKIKAPRYAAGLNGGRIGGWGAGGLGG
jgi:hypothetical protein